MNTMARNPYRAQIARQVITRVSICEFPWRSECDCCDNALVGRTDGMKVVLVTRTVKGSKKSGATLLCEPCATAQHHLPSA